MKPQELGAITEATEILEKLPSNKSWRQPNLLHKIKKKINTKNQNYTHYLNKIIYPNN